MCGWTRNEYADCGGSTNLRRPAVPVSTPHPRRLHVSPAPLERGGVMKVQYTSVIRPFDCVAECGKYSTARMTTCETCTNGTIYKSSEALPSGEDGGDQCLCRAGHYVSSNVCTACAAGKTNAAGNDASGSDASCTATLCAENEYVSSNVCTACAAGKTRGAGDDASGSDTSCTATLCAANEYVSSNVCTARPANSSNGSGDDASGSDT